MRDTPDFDIPDSAPKAAVSIRYDPDGFKPDQVNPLDDIKKLNDLNHNLVAAFRRITADDSLDNVTPKIPSVDPPPGDGGGVGGGGGSGPGPVDEPEEPESAGFTDVDADGVHAASIDALYVADTGSAATTFTDTGVTAGTQHVYRVKAINGAGAGERSNYVNVDP